MSEPRECVGSTKMIRAGSDGGDEAARHTSPAVQVIIDLGCRPRFDLRRRGRCRDAVACLTSRLHSDMTTTRVFGLVTVVTPSIYVTHISRHRSGDSCRMSERRPPLGAMPVAWTRGHWCPGASTLAP